ncbi:MAG: restriction endonuclease [Actinobacteria bacterium]|nr:restriction endonuclease [Actinomycetota bacterium]
MKYLKTYKKIGLEDDLNALFGYFTKTLKESIFTWDYFVNWKKVAINVNKVEKELNLLNYLLGKENIEAKFIRLIKEYPDLKNVLPILIAIRKNKLAELRIITNIKTMQYNQIYSLFYNNGSTEDMLTFFKSSGLKDIFKDRTIKSLVDYCYGVEVGLDTNARKNRTGSLMENIVYSYLKELNKWYNFEYICQANSKKLLQTWGYKIEVDKYSRVFDFAILNKKRNQLFLVETNYYSGGGSKLKSTAGEFIEIERMLKKQGICFVWITDGLGWKTTLNPLFETIKNIDYTFNLELINCGALEELLL